MAIKFTIEKGDQSWVIPNDLSKAKLSGSDKFMLLISGIEKLLEAYNNDSTDDIVIKIPSGMRGR